MSEVNWYVVHTYSGYENKVKANIEKTIENRHLEDQILEVRVPMEEVVEVKNGTKKQVLRKLFPGYVLINMIMNDDTWYVVRNTRGVTGFVGPGSKPVPLTDEEMVEPSYDAFFPTKIVVQGIAIALLLLSYASDYDTFNCDLQAPCYLSFSSFFTK